MTPILIMQIWKGSTADNAQLGRCRGLIGAQLADETKVNDAVWAELLELP